MTGCCGRRCTPGFRAPTFRDARRRRTPNHAATECTETRQPGLRGRWLSLSDSVAISARRAREESMMAPYLNLNLSAGGVAELLFWASAVMLFYVYVGYPLLLSLLAGL